MKKSDTIVDNEILPSAIEKEIFYNENSWRVKVFELSADSSWADSGTGQARILQQVEPIPPAIHRPTHTISRSAPKPTAPSSSTPRSPRLPTIRAKKVCLSCI